MLDRAAHGWNAPAASSTRARALGRWSLALVGVLFLLGGLAGRSGTTLVFVAVVAWLPFVLMLVLLVLAGIRGARDRRRLGRARFPAVVEPGPCGSAAAAVWAVPEPAGGRARTPEAPAVAMLVSTMLIETPQRLLDLENELDVLEWRFAQLRAAGYPEREAAELSARADIDLHVAEELLERGCPHGLALRILR